MKISARGAFFRFFPRLWSVGGWIGPKMTVLLPSLGWGFGDVIPFPLLSFLPAFRALCTLGIVGFIALGGRYWR